MTHDQLFKELLRNFFPDFLRLFLPEEAKRLDLRRLSFVDKEMFTDFPRGKRREADLIARVRTRRGREQLVLVLVEIELRRRRDFAQRMFRYFAQLRLRYDGPILPIVLYLGKAPQGVGLESYEEVFLGNRLLDFRFHAVALGSLEADQYVEAASPLVAGLAPLMTPGKMSWPEIVAHCFHQVVEGPLTDVQRSLLIESMQTYINLTQQEHREVQRFVAPQEYEEIQDMVTTFSEKMIRKGIQKGIQEGKRDSLIRLMRARFGRIPRAIRTRVEQIDSAGKLDELLERTITASSLEDMGLEAE